MEIELLLKIALSAVLGGLIGTERELSGKEAGLRTNILIAVGSTLFTIISLKISAGYSTSDPSRIISQIVTGIGFLGAGSIIQSKISVHGLTTAATIWTVAGIGIAVGTGHYLFSLTITLLIILILYIFKNISTRIRNSVNIHSYTVITKNRLSITTDVKKVIMECGINQFEWSVKKIKSGYFIEIAITASESKKKNFMEKIMEMDGVTDFSSNTV